MKNQKKEMVQFFIWLRNGSAFCVTWLLILLLLYSHLYQIESVPVSGLTKMVFWVIGAVFLFCVFFTRFLVKNWRFVTRLTGFMLLFGAYESAGFYWMGIFRTVGSVAQWLIFAGIIVVLYFLCIGIYQHFSKKQGVAYTQALQQYQVKRSVENGK